MKFKKFFALAAALSVTSAMLFSGCTQEKENSQVSVQTETSVSSAASSDVSDSESSNEETSKTESSSEESSKTESSHTNSTETVSNDESSKEEVSAVKTENTITPRVWEVKDDDGNVMYMMGTIHLGNDEIMHMPDYFESAFASCDTLAVECDMSKAALDITSILGFMYTDKSTIKDHVSKEDYEKVSSMLSGSPYYNQVYDYVKPIMWVSLGEMAAASNIGLSENYAVDTMLTNRAYKENKNVLEVEGSVYQTQVISSIPDEIQNMLFHEMAITDNYLEEMEKEMDELYTNWKQGNEIQSEEEISGEESITEEQQKYIDEYNRIMLVDRNVGMADKAEEYIKSDKKTFFAVGSAHFYGDTGILKLMEDRGYSIRLLTSEDAAEISESAQSQGSSVSSASETDPAVPRAA